MKYHLNRQGQDLGVFTLEELLRHRRAGALSGNELAWCEGMAGWQPLDALLQSQSPARLTPPPLPAAVVRKKGPHPIVIAIIVAATLLFVGQFAWVAHKASTSAQDIGTVRQHRDPHYAIVLASRPVTWSASTLTEADVRKRDRAFRTREYLQAYRANGPRRAPWDAEAQKLIESWIDPPYASINTNNPPFLGDLGDKLAADPDCHDPVVLTVAAVTGNELHEETRRLQRALDAFSHARYKAYPQFFATVTLARLVSNDRGRVAALDASAVQLLRQSMSDGSLRPEDQPEIAETLVNGWGNSFFERNQAVVCPLARAAGKSFRWLALVLEGEYQLNQAWAARGNGYADTVTDQGWRGFETHLAAARKSFTAAWSLRPDLPLAAARMISVSMGDSDLKEMRRWFDLSVAAQIDYPRAWAALRWGLRPRWYGSQQAMLALGVAALNTRRFDTDVPRQFFYAVQDVESDRGLPLGRTLYGRSDIWPNLQRMYEGYLNSGSATSAEREQWRSTYAVVACLAHHFDAARQQLEAMHWKLWPRSLNGWGRDLSLLPLEVAARTGPLSRQIAEAERDYRSRNIAEALRRYTELQADADADERTREFIRCRMASLSLEQRLARGEWVDFQPRSENDPGWVVSWGKPRWLADGSLEVESGKDGHLLYCRARVGRNFEVKGEFEPVRSSNKDFQAGLVMGMPDCDTRLNTYHWYAFRMKRNAAERDVASFSTGWSRQQIYQPVPLNDGRNTFDFRWQDNRVTASVNGQAVFRDAAPRRRVRSNPDEFLVGLGAFNDMNETVICYRNVRIRRLRAGAVPPESEKGAE